MSLRTKKGLFWAKILINLEFKGQKSTKSQKKKRTFRAEKKQAGAELKNKKRTFLGKICEKIEFKYVTNLSVIAKINQNRIELN